jgi:multiple sugar transport system permease protein
MIDHGRIFRAARPRISTAASYAFLFGWLLVTLFPIFWMVSTSFKPPLGWFAWPPHWLPADFTLDNYRQILTFGTLASSTPDSETGFTRLVLSAIGPIRDSLIVAIISSMIAVTLGASLAYTIVRFGTGGKRYAHILLLIRMIPPVVIAVPVLAYFTLPWWRGVLYDAYLGLIIPYVLITLPYAVWLMLSFLQQVPQELEYAARMMGANRLQILRKVVLPLIRPGLAVTFAFVFILNWSEFLLATTLAGQNLTTVTVQLSLYEQLLGPQAAFGTLAIVPLIILGFVVQKHLVTGFSYGLLRK